MTVCKPMYGKHFASMYSGSMVGSGAVVFAVMGYVIANYQLDAVVGAQVRLNAVLLSAILGEPVDSVQRAIDFLCSPDPASTSKGEDGRRLVKIGEFDYRVVNGAKYTAIRNIEEARENARARKAKSRAIRATAPGTPLRGELSAMAAVKRGDTALAEKLAEPRNGEHPED